MDTGDRDTRSSSRTADRPMDDPWATLSDHRPGDRWIADLAASALHRFHTHGHGDLARWRAALHALPAAQPRADLRRAAPRLGAPVENPGALREALMQLHPWRKGPLCLGGVAIDSEWRSDLKWERLEAHVNLRGHDVLDVGCGNGYYGLRMLGVGARLVVGIDPTLVYVMQWLACGHFAGDLPNYVLPLGVDDLPDGAPAFDTVFSMGVLYHRRDARTHLRRLRALLRPGGCLVLETLVLPPDRAAGLLQPPGRYARMRNVWAVPGTGRLELWLQDAGFRDVELVNLSVTTPREQRGTAWMRFESLPQALDAANPGRTVEGHPAPVRAIVLARI